MRQCDGGLIPSTVDAWLTNVFLTLQIKTMTRLVQLETVTAATASSTTATKFDFGRVRSLPNQFWIDFKRASKFATESSP